MMEHNKSLLELNTFGMQVNAAAFARFSSVEELKQFLANSTHERLLILGGGSNILFTEDVEALVLKNEIKGIECVESTDDEVVVAVGAGEVWHEFVLHSIAQNWYGIENMSLIPGSVGASPMQNIGAYGVEIKDVFEKLEALEIATGEIHTFSKDACAFGYRESVFKKQLKGKFVITKVYFRLQKHAELNTAYGAINQELSAMGITAPTLRDVSNAVIAIRSSKLPNPAEIGNAGSFFKNPVVNTSILAEIQQSYPQVPFYEIDAQHVKIPAGWLIETAGWKGKTIENYGVHKNQALVLVNYGAAKGADIYQLSTTIIEDIAAKFGIVLEREVNVM